ncbi:MAG: flagellar hook-associated protein FlgK [Cellulosilyticum sp.]|nr:flagellar hook-associated protein FlgK [Cellulosilyticum sp.]
MAFFELNIAMSGLFAAQRGLQVTSNNITNAATTGYSRQVLSQQASTPISGLSVGMTGTGVTTTGVNRVRDSYIDQKLWTQNPQLGEHNIKVTQNSMMETAFGEPSDTGFTGVFNNMFSAMSTLSNNPSSKENKVVLVEEMESFTKYFNNIAATLQKQQKDLNFEIKGMVDEVNTLATRIQSLNQQIFNAELYGSEASSFRDERDNCIDRLSEIVNVEVSEEEYQLKGHTMSKYTVRVDGLPLVDHLSVNTLDIKARAIGDKRNPQDQEGLYDIVWSTGSTFDINSSTMSGELKGLIDMRDGVGTNSKGNNNYTGIPYYLSRLDTYVQTFAKTMNEQYSKYGNDKKALFTYAEGDTVASGVNVDHSKITAANFSISKELLEDPTSMTTLKDSSNPSDTSFMLELLGQKDNKQMFKEGDPKDYMVAIFAELGINAKEAEMYQSTQVAVTNNLKNQRLSVSQVDTSEEFTYLIQYQQAYQAAAKIMSTIDSIYETTIFKLGNF